MTWVYRTLAEWKPTAMKTAVTMVERATKNAIATT